MKKNISVAVLLSTYNGEKYIREQLDSILNQTYKNIDIYIRDDCSLDDTYKILLEYKNNYKNIFIEKSKKNLGYPDCFYRLTDSVSDYDYYFFSDQDDVWLEDKVSRALSIIEREEDKSKAFAYYAGYNICDSNMNIIGTSNERKNKISFKDTLFEVCGLEFTMVINNKALKLLNSHKPKIAKARGTWMSMLFSCFGNVYYDNYISALYRRHEKSVTSNKLSGLGLWKWRIKKFFKDDNFSSYRIILKDFKSVCEGEMSNKNYKIINLFSSSLFTSRIKKIFYPRRLRTKMSEEVALRIIFLLGKL